jgi:cyclopropane fatty-acyl-phospholipid synthase-like methyltransferase
LRQGKCLLPALLLFSADALLFPGLPESAEGPDKARISNAAGHLQILATDKFLELLTIRPGMTILDIGTRTGQFAYFFAERLAGTGKVYATDIDEGCIRYVEEEAKRRGLDNLFPVLVKPEGVDEFYGRHRYDLIAFFHVRIPDE